MNGLSYFHHGKTAKGSPPGVGRQVGAGAVEGEHLLGEGGAEASVTVRRGKLHAERTTHATFLESGR